MRAVVQDRYGPPEILRIAEVERPEPAEGRLLIRVRASTVSQTDTHIRGAHPGFWRLVAGWRRPRWQSLGTDLAGVVEAVGPGVTEFGVGDEVFGLMPWVGAHAEYVCVRETAPIALKPAVLSFEEAAAVGDGAYQALGALRAGNVDEGSRIVIYGAAGSLGTSAVQIAKHMGAHVTGVVSTGKLELVRSIGADEVIDYTREDLRKRGPTFDVVIDAVGKYAYHWARRALKPGGTYVETDFGGPYKLETFVMLVASRWFGSRRVRFPSGRRSKADMDLMKRLIEAGEYRPVIDRVYPMERVAEAHRYVESWRKTGNVVLTL